MHKLRKGWIWPLNVAKYWNLGIHMFLHDDQLEWNEQNVPTILEFKARRIQG